jgi:lipopolysaccharide/colanic/teichoic acid biosynthesis glycosyltransferase
MGLILTGCSSFGAAEARALEARLSEKLAMRSDEEAAGKFSIRLHVHPEPARPAENGPAVAGLANFPAFHALHGRATLDQATKRVLDIVGSLTLLVVLSPLFLLIAALAKLKSPGPVIFGQVRVGQMMKPFTMLKFRTMHVGADNTLHQEYVTRFINSTAETCGAERIFKLANDPRVTPVGRILRKTSLDELPQLWNVLRGDMSLVGPRPPLGYELEQYKPWHYRRVLEAKPGITGLWQVAGRSRTTFDQMVRLDLRYARTCSVWTDIKILLATPAAVISGKGAC